MPNKIFAIPATVMVAAPNKRMARSLLWEAITFVREDMLDEVAFGGEDFTGPVGLKHVGEAVPDPSFETIFRNVFDREALDDAPMGMTAIVLDDCNERWAKQESMYKKVGKGRKR